VLISNNCANPAPGNKRKEPDTKHLLHGALCFRTTPPPRTVICLARVSAPLSLVVEVTLLCRHRRYLVKIRDKALPHAPHNLSRQH
jgi:hypothetical protein